MKQCPNCGQALAEGHAFCTACGTSAASEQSVPAPVQQPQTQQHAAADQTAQPSAEPQPTVTAQVLPAPAASEIPDMSATPAAVNAAPPPTETHLPPPPEMHLPPPPEMHLPPPPEMHLPPPPEMHLPPLPEAQMPLPPATQVPPPPGTQIPPAAVRQDKPDKPQKSRTLLNTGAGLIATGVLLAAAVLGFYAASRFYLSELLAALNQFCVYAIAAIAVVLSMRAKGPDLSISAVMASAPAILGLMLYFGVSVFLALPLTFVICAAFGLINGTLTALLKLPAVLLTLLTGLVARSVVTLLLGGGTFELPFIPVAAGPDWALIAAGAALVTAFLLVLLTSLGTPKYKRQSGVGRVSVLLAYVLSAAFASLAGMLMLLSEGSGLIGLSADMSGEFFIVFVFALLASSRALDNRFAPVLFSLIPALIWTLGSYALAELPLMPEAYAVIYGGLALALLAAAYAFRIEMRSSKALKKQNALPLSQ